MWEGGERKKSPPATRLVAAGLFGRWGEEKRMRKVHAPCQIERERAQFEFANVSAAAPCRPSARPQMAQVATHKICSVGCRRGTSFLSLIGRLQLFGESKEQAGVRARSENVGCSHPLPTVSMELPPRGICTIPGACGRWMHGSR